MLKKIILLPALFIFLTPALHAQFRKLKPAEISYLNDTHLQIWSAMPHEYKNWKASGDAKEFDAAKFWCPDEASCYGTCPVSVGVGDPYSLDVFTEFTMPGEQSDKLKVASFSMIKNFQDAGEIAVALKYAAVSKLQIKVYSNIDGGKFVLGWCDKTPPVKIELPVATTLALKGIRSADCPMYNSGIKTVDMSGAYWDDAIIFLGQPVAKKTNDDLHDNISRTDYMIGFSKSLIGKTITQNIVVELSGDSADIDAAIGLIDWKKLYELLGK